MIRLTTAIRVHLECSDADPVLLSSAQIRLLYYHLLHNIPLTTHWTVLTRSVSATGVVHLVSGPSHDRDAVWVSEALALSRHSTLDQIQQQQLNQHEERYARFQEKWTTEQFAFHAILT